MINVDVALKAKEKLSSGAWNYLVGGAENELALRRNRRSFQKWNYIPTVLEDVSYVDATTEFLNEKLRMPIIAAPIGGLTQFHEGGDVEWAKGCEKSNITGVASGVARFEHKKIIEESNANLYYQHYFFGDDAWVKDQIQMVTECGYKAIVVTVDTAYYGQRERDILGDYDAKNAGWRETTEPPMRERGPALTWDEVEKIKSYTHLPVIIKGIVSKEDVKKAISADYIDAIWISNHGGRQLDNTVSSIEALSLLSETLEKSKLPAIFDGGVRRGSDVLLAYLLGADVVAVGRLPVFGLAHDGAIGMMQVFDNLLFELKTTMGLMGLKSLDIDKKKLRKEMLVENSYIMETGWDCVEAWHCDIKKKD